MRIDLCPTTTTQPWPFIHSEKKEKVVRAAKSVRHSEIKDGRGDHGSRFQTYARIEISRSAPKEHGDREGMVTRQKDD
jgi:hypothetical protein